ncbi:MAG: VCBS repeat-containing protein, partial [Deltaproteobacteria bacterium]|nr:VCBS repeat-containing protein [Deltaproteobacteria bacterium]
MRKVLTAFFSLGVVSFAHPASAGVEFEAGGVVAELDAAAVTGVVGAFTDGGDLELLWCADGGEARIGHISVEGIAGVRGLLEGVECTAVLALQLPEFGPQPPTFDAPLEVLLAGPDGVYAADFSVGGNTMTSQLLSTPTTALAAGRWDGVPAVVLGHLDGSLSRCPLDLDGCVSLPLPGAPSPVVALAVGDIDGTADPELLVGREDGSFFLLRGSLEPATVVLRSGKLLDRTIDAIGLGEVGPDRRQVIALASSPLAVSATDPGECVLPGAPEWVGAVPDAACSDVRLLNPTWTPDWGEMIAGDVAFPLDSRDRVSTISLADLDRDGFNEAMISVAPRSGDCARPSLPWGRSFLPETGGASNDGAGGVTQALLVDYDGDGDRDLLELGWSCEEAGAQPQPQIDILPLGQGVVQERRDLTLDQGGRTIRQVLWGAGDPSPPLWTLATDAETALVCRIRRAATSPAGKACSAALPFQPNPLPPGMAIRVTAAGEEAAVSLGDRVAILRVSEGGVTLEEDVLPYAWTQVGALAWGSRCQDAPEGPGCASQDVLAVTGVTEQGNLSTVLPFLQLVTPDGPTLSDPLWTWSSLVSDIRWLDATGNGQLDLAISSIAGPVSTLVRSPASPLGYETTWVSSAELETHSLRAEDFDGDGALDLVTFNGLETEGAERMYSNQGGGSFALAGSFGFGEDSRGTSTLDIDSDGRPEIVTTVPQEFCDEGSGQLVVHEAPLLPFDFSPSAGWAPASCGSPQSTDWTSARGRWVGAVGG